MRHFEFWMQRAYSVSAPAEMFPNIGLRLMFTVSSVGKWEGDEEVDGSSPKQPFTLTVGYGALTQRLNTGKEKG